MEDHVLLYKSDLVRILKQFYLWLIESKEISLPDKKIRAIKIPAKENSTKTASDLLASDEIPDLISACMNPRDRAIIMTMYEGGFRVGEIGLMKWGDLKFDGTGVIVNVMFTTGIPRYVRLVMAKEYLIKSREIVDIDLFWRNTYYLPEFLIIIYFDHERLISEHCDI